MISNDEMKTKQYINISLFLQIYNFLLAKLGKRLRSTDTYNIINTAV